MGPENGNALESGQRAAIYLQPSFQLQKGSNLVNKSSRKCVLVEENALHARVRHLVVKHAIISPLVSGY
jgi:hypothetical protein